MKEEIEKGLGLSIREGYGLGLCVRWEEEVKFDGASRNERSLLCFCCSQGLSTIYILVAFDTLFDYLVGTCRQIDRDEIHFY